MAVLTDIAKGEPAAVLGFGLLAIALPIALPALRPDFRPLLKSAVKLFVEAEFGADNAVIESLADAAVDRILGAAATAAPDETRQTIRRHVERFARRADQRAGRLGWDEADRRARYDRHVHTLKEKIARTKRRRGGRKREALDYAEQIAEAMPKAPAKA